MRPNGSSVRQLTFNDAADFRPDWSPDSRQITFTSGQGRRSARSTSWTPTARNQTNVTANLAGGDGRQRLVAGREEDRLHRTATSTSSR